MLSHGHFLVAFFIVVTLFTFSFFVTDAFAQYYYGDLKLDPIPSEVKTGDKITFTGQLLTTDGYAYEGATIYIKDDVTFDIDTVLGTVVTDVNGEFTATWEAQPRSGGGTYDFYAVFEGDSQFSYSKSRTYSVTVGDSYTTSGGTSTPGGGSTTSYLPSVAGCVPNSYDHFVIAFDPIPYSTYAGETITFTGKVTCNGNSLSNLPIYIVEDDFFKIEVLASGYTDSNGKFSIPWKIVAGTIEKDFDIYAMHQTLPNENEEPFTFESNEQVMTVIRVPASIEIDSFQKSIGIGKPIIFTGTLKIGHGDVEGLVVYIKDEDPLDPDDLLTTAYVNSDGRFSANWLATNVDEDGIADIYAVFEGFDTFQRVTTCDVGATSILGGSCLYTIPLQITGFIPPPTIPPPTTTPPPTAIPPTGGEALLGDEYMKFLYSMSFNKSPLIAIVPDPDSYDEVKRHIIPSQEGVLLWNSMLKQKHGGNWNVNFEVIKPGSKFSQKPDVIMNLVTREMDSSCIDWSGYASIRSTPIKPINIVVCADSFRGTSQVQATAAHEFIHAVGLGHSFNKPGDLMCSVENGKPTCNNSLFKSNIPSDFNLAAIGKLYGKDGFLNPNSQVFYGEKFSASDYQNYVPPTVAPIIPVDPVSPPTTTDYDTVIKINKSIERLTLLFNELSNITHIGITAIEIKNVEHLHELNSLKNKIKQIDSKLEIVKENYKIAQKKADQKLYTSSLQILTNLETSLRVILDDYYSYDRDLRNLLSRDVNMWQDKLQEESTSEPEELGVAPFVDKSKDPKDYVKRYVNEKPYRTWFDKNYPEYTFHEALGITKTQFDYLSKEIQNSNSEIPEKIQLTAKSEQKKKCGSGTHLENNVCVLDKQAAIEEKQEKDIFTQFLDMLKSLFS